MDKHFLDELKRILTREHHDPHHILGLHDYFGTHKVIRLWRPGAATLFLEVFGKIVESRRIHDAGVFEYIVPKSTTYADYRVYHVSGLLAHDPYAFFPTFGELDQYLFGKGVHYELYTVMGARVTTEQGVFGTKFSVWAPVAKQVALVGSFNHWDGRVNLMRSMGTSGVWELFIPGVGQGTQYKFEIKTQSGEIRVKADPYAYYSEMRPKTASVVWHHGDYTWQDQQWMDRRTREQNTPKPMNVYEVHLGSWRKRDGQFLNYRELADQLVEYCHQMNFTHVELMPISEHPLDESWGYQVTGYYAVTSRYGTPDDFKALVDILHQNNIGVFIDWVPGHFPSDDFALSRFDGSCLYEHEDARQGHHPHWKTLIFNYGRNEVSNCLLANALFWLDYRHVDGLRVDAVASMIYLDYGRDHGGWIPNPYGGKENLEALEFIRHTNSIVHRRCPGVMMIAEESTSFTGVSHSVDYGGLGFDMKWNMGWMNDTLLYFERDPVHRHYHHNELTFGLLYAFSERFVLVLSHDEVVHGKRSLLSKIPGDLWQKFAGLRLLYSYMMCQPGKKLLFMGGEIGQWNEWNCKEQLDWNLLEHDTHRGVQKMVGELNHFYLTEPALWEKDFDYAGFEWVDFSDVVNGVISYRRKSSKGELLCIHNFTPTYHPEYVIRLPNLATICEVFNTDSSEYGGSGKVNLPVGILGVERKGRQNGEEGFRISLAPLATMIFKITFT